MNTRYNKVFRDLTTDFSKNFMLVLAIAIGVFGIGTILAGYAVLTREMAKNYLGSNPASATIKADGASFEKNIVDSVKQFSGIDKTERHATVSARMKIGNDWFPLLLFVVNDFQNMQTNKVTSLSGEIIPPTGTMLAERTAFRVMQSEEGKEIVIKTPNGKQTAIRISGTVHDPGLAPAWQEQTGYGFITLSTLQWLGESSAFDELRFTLSDVHASREQITEKANLISSWLEQRGYVIHEVQIPPPNKHPHQGQMNAILSLFTTFSFLILILSSILVSASIATLMVKQVREIGIMKTVGANSLQVSGLYLLMILTLCVVAVGIGIPLSRYASTMLYSKISILLNLRIFDETIPFWVPLVQSLAGIFIPLIAASVPVLRGSRISVRNAIDHYGMSKSRTEKTSRGSQESLIARLMKLQFFGETVTLSLRNTFRQRSRLLLTLGLLSAGGAMFMTAMNVSKAWDNNLQKILEQRFYDLDIRLFQSIQQDEISSAVHTVSDVRNIEVWSCSTTSFVTDVPYDIVNTYPDKGHGSFIIVGTPIPTQLISLPMLDGRWLSATDSNDVVLNIIAHALSPHLKIGDSVMLSIETKATKWRIVGFTEDLYSPATAYVPLQSFQAFTGTLNCSNMIRLSFADRKQVNIVEKTREIEAALLRNNISVNQNITALLFRNAIGEHMGVLVNSLLAMAILMALVGTLGLTSTMSINIMERTREIGVMRAIGATPKQISRLVMVEGLITGIMSIAFAFALSLLLSLYLGQLLGSMAFRTPLSLTVSNQGMFLWIAIIIFGSIAATFFPAQRASSITTREALAYE